ncbi:MAG: T9SS type A sorting domain-containing protein [Candidatus Marinimicrobia bacterium]|nr:T9SS type A sorting domain-containing protein [Candidatus Neomarinimicrobiota bacterium]
MKRLLSCILLILLVSTPAFSYSLNWTTEEYMTPEDLTRGMAYSPQTDHIYVATRVDNKARVVILNPKNGETIGMLDTTDTGFQGGTYRLNQVSVSDDGTIYVCNLSVPQYSPNDKFKIYKYKDESSAPELIFENAMSGNRYGDSFTAVGSGDNTYLYSSAYNSDTLAIIRSTSNDTYVENTIGLPSINAARHSISPVEPGGNLWISGAGTSDPPVRLVDELGNTLVEVPTDTMIGAAAGAAHHWKIGPYNLVSAIHTNAQAHTILTIQYNVDELGTYTLDYFGNRSDSLATGNINATSVIDYDTTRHNLYVLDGTEFISSLNMDSLVQVGTPRDTGMLAIQLDGKKKEYTHYERLETENDRALYLTWSDDIIYTAISGNTLYAPYQERGLYIAFNTDPDGSNGTTSPPDGASSIQELPFNADVVVQFDSDDWADLVNDPVTDKWTTGKVFKWNGSEWNESTIEGLDINYGAMCIIGDGNDSLITEIGVARSPQGIGNDISKMQVKVYLAETASDGDVMAAFPNNNETGNGVSFTSYYQFDDLGHGIYPAFDVQEVGTGTDVVDNNYQPEQFQLSQNYPNPFNPVTTIEYTLSNSGNVELSVFDLQGRLVEEIVSREQKSGHYKYNFHAQDQASGIYFYKLTVDAKVIGVRKMALLK